jgi:hypothetical protein
MIESINGFINDITLFSIINSKCMIGLRLSKTDPRGSVHNITLGS